MKMRISVRAWVMPVTGFSVQSSTSCKEIDEERERSKRYQHKEETVDRNWYSGGVCTDIRIDILESGNPTDSVCVRYGAAAGMGG